MANEIAKLFVTIGANTGGLDKALNKLENKMNTVGKNMMKVGGGILLGVAAIAGPSIKLAADFDTAMREVNTMMQLSEGEFKSFSKEVQDLAYDMGVSATGAAEALYQAISAGVPKENAIEFLRVATKAAIGGVTDTMTAVDGLTSIMNAFKIPVKDATKVADIMFSIIKGGKVNFEELSASIFQVSPIASASGIKFEEVAGALATMTKQGIKSAQATTQLRQAIVMLQNPTDEMKSTIIELGYSSGQTMVQELGLAGSLNILRDASEGSNEKLLSMFGSVEAGQAVLALTGDNAQTFATDLDNVANSAGIAEEAFAQMEKSTGRKIEKLKERLKNVAVTIGTSLIPAFESIMETLGPIIERVGNWIAQNPELIKTLAAVGVALVGAGGIIFAFSKLIGVIRSVATGLAILQGLSGPAGWVALGAGAAVIAGAIASINAALGGEEGATMFDKGGREAVWQEAWSRILMGGGTIDEARAEAEAAVNAAYPPIPRPAWKPELPGWAVSIAPLVQADSGVFNIPSFAGFEGLIPGRLGEPQLAMVHGGEFISQPGNVNQVSVDRMVARAIEKGLAGIRVMVGGKDVAAVVFREGYRMKQVRI